MKQKTLDFLEAHKSEQPSTFTEDAKWRQENEVWLKWSRGFADGLLRDAHAPCFIRFCPASKDTHEPFTLHRLVVIYCISMV